MSSLLYGIFVLRIYLIRIIFIRKSQVLLLSAKNEALYLCFARVAEFTRRMLLAVAKHFSPV